MSCGAGLRLAVPRCPATPRHTRRRRCGAGPAMPSPHAAPGHIAAGSPAHRHAVGGRRTIGGPWGERPAPVPGHRVRCLRCGYVRRPVVDRRSGTCLDDRAPATRRRCLPRTRDVVFLAGGRKAMISPVVCREYPVRATSWLAFHEPDPDTSAAPRRMPTPGKRQVRCSPALALPGSCAGLDAETHPPRCPSDTDIDEDPWPSRWGTVTHRLREPRHPRRVGQHQPSGRIDGKGTRHAE